MIIFEGVTKTYDGDVVGLDDVSFHIPKGEFVFLVGPSGSGKSTLIRLVLRELRPDQGRVVVAGRNIGTLKRRKIPHLRRNIGCVFQDFKLLPNKTVYENVAYALQVVGEPRKNIRRKVPEILKLVGLFEKMNNLPSEISGGEEQRVSIARALVNKPPLLLADEPTGNLDPETSMGIMKLLERINRTGTTVVIATHDRDMVNRMRKRVFALEQGRLVRDERQGAYERPTEAVGATGEMPVAAVPVAVPVGSGATAPGVPQPAGQTGAVPVPVTPAAAAPPSGPGQTAPIPAGAPAGSPGQRPASPPQQTRATVPGAVPGGTAPAQRGAAPGAQVPPSQAAPRTAPGAPAGQTRAGAPSAPGAAGPARQQQSPGLQPGMRPPQAPQGAQPGQLPRQTPPVVPGAAPAAPQQGQYAAQPGSAPASPNGSTPDPDDEVATERSSDGGPRPKEARR